MSSTRTRRTFLKNTSATVVLGLPGISTSGGEPDMKYFICVTCGSQFAISPTNPSHCPICDDERQYVGHTGQIWTTLDEYRKTHKNVFTQEEPGLHSILTQPKAGIGQRAFLVHTPEGNMLWDCIPPLDDPTIETIKKHGGLAGIAVSHPHYYCTMVEWSHAFGNVPIYLHKLDAKWVMRPDDSIVFWEGNTKRVFGGMTLVKTGGHFDGFQVLHWPAGAEQKGVLLTGDQPYVCQDRRWVSFMYSYPNLIPLNHAAIRGVVDSLKPFSFDRLYGAFPGQVVKSDAKVVIERSAARYVRSIQG